MSNKLQSMDAVIRAHLLHVLDHCEWNKSQAALVLELDRRTVLRMIKRFKLTPLAPALEPLVLRCPECGTVSEPGELDPRLMHTHTCRFAGFGVPAATTGLDAWLSANLPPSELAK